MQGKQSLKQAPKFEFQSVKDAQRLALHKMQSAEEEFIYQLEKVTPPCWHTLKAKRFLREALKQCNAAILFNWQENNA